MARSTHCYQSVKDARLALQMRIQEMAQARVRYGWRKIRGLANREDWTVGRKRVYRLYREDGLTLRQQLQRRHRAGEHRRERYKQTAPNQIWSLNLVADQLVDGQRVRALTVVDNLTRESLAIEVAQGIKGQ